MSWHYRTCPDPHDGITVHPLSHSIHLSPTPPPHLYHSTMHVAPQCNHTNQPHTTTTTTSARYTISALNTPRLRASVGVTQAQLGWVLTSGMWTYAATATLTGALADKMGGKRAMILSAVGTGLANAALGGIFLSGVMPAAYAFPSICALYSTSNFFQGFGTSACVKINAGWYTPKERGVFSGIFNVAITSGYYLALSLSPAIAKRMSWPYVDRGGR